jgi:diguanylate cyclase (GGDEF)-like protein/excisionase family DNA binding protein
MPVPFDAVPDDAPTLSVREAAAVLGIHPNTLRAWTDRGVLPCLRINRRGDRRYRRSDLVAFLGSTAATAGRSGTALHRAPRGGRPSWAAQLRSIQLLGARLSRMASLRDIGEAIAAELGRLIDYHNVRVYTVDGEDLVPVAWHGHIGEYVEETEEQLRLKVGQGITGWVALHGVPANLPDAANDPRARVIPGTDPDLPESLLVVPAVYEEQVIGVIVLSKLGLHQFSDDDQRLLVIYASFAAQAMAVARATEQLRDRSLALARQLRSQRELLALTESLLTSMDHRAILEQIADRLGVIVPFDVLAIKMYDPAVGALRTIIARGLHPDVHLAHTVPPDQGVSGWVFTHSEPQIVRDMLTDPRVLVSEDMPATPGSLIAVPLRGREGTIGVIFLERQSPDPAAAFDEEAFELVKLFAAHASIALRNAAVYEAVAVRARTDGLTGLMNHATFKEMLATAVQRGESFSLLMIDLDAFKRYNDRFLHEGGDRLLAALAAVLRRTGREKDLAFRYGGDEFCLILPDTDRDGARSVARKVARAIRRASLSVGEGSTPVAVTASIGVATFPEDGADRRAILLAADRASYVAKRQGGNRIVTAAAGRAAVGDVPLKVPTPVDSAAPGEEAVADGAGEVPAPVEVAASIGR